MVRVAIVGCGKIADQHVNAVSRINSSQVVAVADREPLMAEQLAERHSIEGCYSSLETLLREVTPDVVHITTPPQSHYTLALQCLAAGAHVLLEKPFTVTAGEAADLIDTAVACGRRITAGHNYQFTPEMLRMRQKVKEGFLGGPVVHVESHWSYDLGDTSYVGPLLGNPNHWVRRLPGGLLHNIISHGVARLAEFLSDDIVELHVSAHQSAQLRKMGGQNVMDELRVMIRDAHGVTASFCFSTQIKPGVNCLRVCGPRNTLTVDIVSGTLLEHRSIDYKSYLTFLGPPLAYARQHLASAWRNATDIVHWRLHQDSGMKEMIEQFHASLRPDRPSIIPYREILLTARIMDAIFAKISHSVGPASPALAGHELAAECVPR